MSNQKLKGIGGWLLFYVIIIFLSLISYLGGIVGSILIPKILPYIQSIAGTFIGQSISTGLASLIGIITMSLCDTMP